MTGSAQALYQQVLNLKNAYDAYAAQNPGADTLNNTYLASLHQQAQAAEAQLSSAGYGTAAETLATGSYQTAYEWALQNPDLGASAATGAVSLDYTGGGSGYATGTPTDPTGYQTNAASSGTSTGGLFGWFNKLLTGNSNQGVLGAAGSAAGNAAGQALGQTVGTAAQEAFAGAGLGIGQAGVSIGQGFGAGAASFANQAGAALVGAVRQLFWPAVVLGGLVVFGRVYRIRKNITRGR